MTVVAVTADNARWSAMDDNTNSSGIGSGAGPQNEPDFYYQRTSLSGAVSKKVSNGTGGLYDTTGSARDMTATGRTTWLAKVLMTTVNIQDALAVQPFVVRVGSGTGDYHEYILHADDSQSPIINPYPAKESWLIVPIDPNVVNHRSDTTGTPVLTAVDYFAVVGDTSATVKSENIVMDAIDAGTGLYLVSGTGADPAGVFQDFVGDDEDEVDTGRYGYVHTKEGILYVFGRLVIGETDAGTNTETVFTDENRTLVFSDGRFAAGWSGLEVELAVSGTAVTWTGCVFEGRARSPNTRFEFQTVTDIDASTEEVLVGVDHGLRLGDVVTYSDEGGSDSIGLTDATDYYVTTAATQVDDEIRLSTSKANSVSETAINLSDGSGETHRLTLNMEDTRPIFEARATTGTFAATSCRFTSFASFTCTSACTFTSTSFINSSGMSLSGGTLDSCTVTDHDTAIGEAFIEDTTLANISDCTFDNSGGNSEGHAVEVTSTGTYSYVGNTHTGYGPDREQFDTISDVNVSPTDSLDITGHGFNDGDPVYYNDEGGSDSIGLTDGNLYFVNSVGANEISLHNTEQDALNDRNRVALSLGSTGETHSLYSGNAAIFNDSGGAVTINVSGGGDTPTVRNGTGASTTINNNINITFTGMRDNTEVRVYDNGDDSEIAGIENATAGSPDDRSFQWSDAQGNDVRYIIHNETYETITNPTFTIPAADSTIPIQQRFDRNAE